MVTRWLHGGYTVVKPWLHGGHTEQQRELSSVNMKHTGPCLRHAITGVGARLQAEEALLHDALEDRLMCVCVCVCVCVCASS